MSEKQEFEEWVKEIFLKIQNAWNENDYESLINIESKFLYERDSEKIKKYIKENKREVRECVIISCVEIYGHKENEENQSLKAILKVSLENYVYDINTKEIFSGIKDYKVDRIYKITFRKREKQQDQKVRCEKCNAPIDLFNTRKCEYCGTILKINKFDWVVEDIECFDVEE